jgi:acyl-CoA synthetase (NDP forming)
LQLATISERTQVRLQELTPAWATIGNPADIWSTIEQLGAHEAYQRMCSVMIEDERVDILLLIAVLLEEGEFDSGAALAPVKKAHPGKPILACRMGGKKNLLEAYQLGLERIGIPVYDGPGEAIAAAARLWERAQIVGRFAGATS